MSGQEQNDCEIYQVVSKTPGAVYLGGNLYARKERYPSECGLYETARHPEDGLSDAWGLRFFPCAGTGEVALRGETVISCPGADGGTQTFEVYPVVDKTACIGLMAYVYTPGSEAHFFDFSDLETYCFQTAGGGVLSLYQKEPTFRSEPSEDPPADDPLCAAVTCAENGGTADEPACAAHLDFLRAHAAEDEVRAAALEHPALLRMMCGGSCLDMDCTEAYLEESVIAGVSSATVELQRYRQRRWGQ